MPGWNDHIINEFRSKEGKGVGPFGDHLLLLTTKGAKTVASILGDIEKGGAVEGKQIVGDMLARARRHGIAAPNLRFAYAHLQTYEARRSRSGLK